MSKSTPLNQLPSQPMIPTAQTNQQQFLNEQQKQMVTQAQQAAQAFTLPQNTQMSTDIITDDDATIQEVLNELNASSQPPQMIPSGMPVIEQITIPQMTMNSTHDITQMQQINGMHQNADSAQPQMQEDRADNIEKSEQGVFQKLFNHFLKDVKLILILVLSYVFVTFVPVQNFISMYFMSIERIPYSSVVIRAILSSVIAYSCIKVIV